MVHLARTHDIHGARGRLSIKAVYRFFPLLEERRWSDAQKFLNKVEGAEDEWIEGYVQALNGMLIALKESHSSAQPYIQQIKRYSGQELRNLKEDEWIEGYVQALNGMLIALKESHSSPEPYILQIKRYSGQELRNLKEDFATLSNKPVNTTFDKGYIQAWINYVSQQQSKAKSSNYSERGV